MATYPTAAPGDTLAAIQTKVRRLTRSPSEAQLSEDELNNYINTFVIYDFPEHLRTYNLRTTYSFYTNPYQDEYPTDKASFGDVNTYPTIASNPLYNFQNKFISVHDPIYIAGYQSVFSQSESQFFGIYPKITSIASIGFLGDGATTYFTGVINTNQSQVPSNFTQQISLLQRQVMFDSLTGSQFGMQMVDVPVIDTSTGNTTISGNLYNPYSAQYQSALINPPILVDPVNNINYATGEYDLTFLQSDGATPVAPGSGETINSQTVMQTNSLPMAVLYYANKFIVRPVPDQTYKITMEVFRRPTQLLLTTSVPELEEWWQLIAYGASKKIFEDRMEMDSVQMIMPEYKTQMNLCNRRTIVQLANQRTATIFTDQLGASGNWSGWGNGTGNW